MHEELSSGNVTEATHQFKNAVDSHSQPSSHDSIPASEIKSAACRKRVFVDDGMVASEFSNISKSLNSLVQVEAANAEAMNALQCAFTQELEAQKRTAERREKLFSVLTKFTEFTSDQIVKVALMISQNEERLNLFFTTPDEFKPESVRQVLKI